MSLSRPPVTKRCPSGIQAQAVTAAVCREKARTRWPDAASHRHTRKSFPAAPHATRQRVRLRRYQARESGGVRILAVYRFRGVVRALAVTGAGALHMEEVSDKLLRALKEGEVEGSAPPLYRPLFFQRSEQLAAFRLRVENR
eukprot:5922495-Pyramimonas_sp.AAC.1